ncbi:VOC family protein [Agarilytica rhodophyticola]|uniref:VOC family protein n=1 Tax=Agarilytica rhodophyticola TaxID=1737490 RepID=UPI000B3477D1|nr:VOC family protein [Agarilytica rhodophyticola]
MKLGFVITYVENVKEVLDFYSKAFGVPIKLEFEDNGQLLYGELSTEGATLGFASHEMGKMNLSGAYQKLSLADKPVGQEIVFEHEDVDGVYNNALKEGAISIAPPADKEWGQRIAYVRGIDGALIEICSPMDI